MRRSSRIRGHTACSRTVLKPTSDRNDAGSTQPPSWRGTGPDRPNASIARTLRRCRSLAAACTSIRPSPLPGCSGATAAVISSTASPDTGAVGKAGRPRHEVGRGVGDVAGRGAVDVRDPPDAAPLQQGRGHPGLLVQLGVAALVRPLGEDRVQLPEEAGPAGVRQVVQPVERQRQQLTPAHRGRILGRPRAPRRPRGGSCRFPVKQGAARETLRHPRGPSCQTPTTRVPHPYTPEQHRTGRRTDHDRARLAPGPLEGFLRPAHGGHDGLGDPRAVLGRLPPGGGLPRRRDALPVRPADGHRGGDGAAAAQHPRRHRLAVRLRPGRRAAAGTDPRGDGAGGHPRPRRRHRGHDRVAAGAGPGHPGVHRPR